MRRTNTHSQHDRDYAHRFVNSSSTRITAFPGRYLEGTEFPPSRHYKHQPFYSIQPPRFSRQHMLRVLLLPPLRTVIFPVKVPEPHSVDSLCTRGLSSGDSLWSQTDEPRDTLNFRGSDVSNLEHSFQSGRDIFSRDSLEECTESFGVFEGCRRALALVGKHWEDRRQIEETTA